ncbi:DgyrCDS234 [Dimorphilus gyrociliatus]|uniref:U3 small nucleolar RNA-associated protein 11 n=1 Tax=Dimorphilus gyrociliatus TaxID=2664684 RepID=A0A7I8V580_9ANNE|nr:DgyrCDS234 [Dimorphilus gyrociliatus]
MSSYRNVLKSYQKTHRERGQLESRKHLGFLEKKKDYKIRANERAKKEKIIKTLKNKALDKNPDEFYFNMINSKVKSGIHEAKDEEKTYTDAQHKLMNTQDLGYVKYKHTSEKKKIEQLKSSMHFLDVEKPNKHIVFVDSKTEEREFDPVKYFDTHPSLVDRSFNRPKMSTLEKPINIGEKAILRTTDKRIKTYKELGQRLDREKELRVIQDKLSVKKRLLMVGKID